MNRCRPLVALLCAAAAAAQPAATAAVQHLPRQPVTWSASLAPGIPAVVAGGRFVVTVTATIDEGWHVYGVEDRPDGPRALRIELAPGQFFTAGKLQAPEPSRELDGAFSQVTAFYGKTTTFRLPLTALKQATAGEYALALEVSFQACDGRICLPGRKVKLSVPVRIEAGHIEP